MPKKSSPKSTDRVPLTRERILRAATELADEAGLEALSMRKLATSLGVEAMSLYNHVANKDDLLDGMVDVVAGQIALPRMEDGWREAMRTRAISAHEVLVRHPWVGALIVSRVNVGPAMLRYVDATLGCLRAAGFTPEEADHAWNAIDSHIYGYTLQELNFPFQEPEYADAATDNMDLLPAEEYPHLRELALLVSKGRYDGVHDFEFGLELILDGLDRIR